MNLQGFSVRHLTVLDVVFTERHIGRAADRLGLSQPAVSNTLAWLRIHFGDPLLVRRGGDVVPHAFCRADEGACAPLAG